MANNSGQNQDQSFVQKNRNPLIIAAIVIILLVIYLVTRGNTETGQRNNNTNQTNSQQNQGNSGNSGNSGQQNQGNTQGGENPAQPSGDSSSPAAAPTTGNLSISGKLLNSDNAAKGNYVVESSQGRIYIQTKRDYASLVGKDVTLAAEGTLTAFTLVDITDKNSTTNEEPSIGGDQENPPTPAVQGDSTQAVRFAGKLAKSDNDSKGNYLIISGSTKVYLQSKQDYNAWIDSEVELTADGTLASFSGAKLMKK